MKKLDIKKGILTLCLVLACVMFLQPNIAIADAASDENVAKLSITGTFDYEKAFEVLELVNKERKKNGVSALEMNSELLDAAMQRAAECSLYYSHTRPNGEECYTIATSHHGFLCGENIAAGQTSAEMVMEGWINSPGHCGNILNSAATDIGIGCFYQDGLYYWVQNFGMRYISEAASESSAKKKTATVEIYEDYFTPYISHTSLELKAGKSETLSVYVDGNGFGDWIKVNGSSLEFSSTDKTVAKVSSKGKVTAVGNGSVKIKVKIPGTSHSYSIPVKVKVTSLSKPKITVKNKAADGKPQVTWEEVKYAEKYEVYRATSKDGTYKKLGTTSKTSYTNNSAVPGKKYYYKVRAICGDVKSKFSEIKSISCDCARPEVTISRNSKGKPKVKWEKVEGANKYVVYRATSKNGEYKKWTTTTKTSYTNTSAKKGKTYYYKVRAICQKSEAGNSAYSTVKSIKAK